MANQVSDMCRTLRFESIFENEDRPQTPLTFREHEDDRLVVYDELGLPWEKKVDLQLSLWERVSIRNMKNSCLRPVEGQPHIKSNIEYYLEQALERPAHPVAA